MLKPKRTTSPTAADYMELLRVDTYFAGLPKELPAGFLTSCSPWLSGSCPRLSMPTGAAGMTVWPRNATSTSTLIIPPPDG